MAQALICDQCKRAERKVDPGRALWLQVEREGLIRDFCGTVCLREWAEAQIVEATAEKLAVERREQAGAKSARPNRVKA